MTDGFVGLTWVVEHAKITRYLLDLSHKEGGSKAKYLLALGFTPDVPRRWHPPWFDTRGPICRVALSIRRKAFGAAFSKARPTRRMIAR